MYNVDVNYRKIENEVSKKMKKIVICTFLIAAGAATLLNIDNKIETKAPEFALKNSYSITLGYDK